MNVGAWLAVDWGTTNVRAWLVDGARVLRRQEFALGVGQLQPGDAARHFRDTIRPAMDAADLPAMLCGMIGSTLGWEVAPYVDCPVDLLALRARLHRVDAADPPAWIVPGLKGQRPDGGPDVMRGEETQVFGWALGNESRSAGERLICLPGTHTKWVRCVDGRIDGFVTAMTGELFALLRNHSVLRAGPAQDDENAFARGLEAAGDGNALASRIFTARSRLVSGDMAATQVESYFSGLLIGAEAAALPALFRIDRGRRITVIGERSLSQRYRQALAANGFEVDTHDGEAAALAGLMALMTGFQR
ncbi:MAG: 2-dehydro-3-deoxygalactonokinase [Cyanobacteria bacterium]|nr:2-dehydro-3-deoxygalactonokinase [Cyanobacteriota bacterium]